MSARGTHPLLAIPWRKAKAARELAALCYRDLRVNGLGQIFPIAPHTLNLLVNDICNSKCQMCLIWEQKRDKEFTTDELANILRDPLFKRLQYIGVSGGEPTLRKDLPEIYRVLVSKHPRIKQTGIITNAIRADDVISLSEASALVCRNAGVPFNIMVSLDGIGELHDHIRGRPGNFKSALEVLKHFRDKTDIPLSIGCTITKDNVWGIDEVLEFCRRERIYGRFRVAEFIDRLYNTGQRQVIRNFSESEAYQLALFFRKLELTYETSPLVRRTYRNISQMIMEGAPRSIKCPWQAQAATLDCRGQLMYCAPKSPILGNALTTSASKLYRDNIDKRKQILKHDCDSCIHDYHAEETTKEWWLEHQTRRWCTRLTLERALIAAGKVHVAPPVGQTPTPRSVLIVGWYGSETAGDKAILGGVIGQVRERAPTCRITLASLHPFLSRWTVRELSHLDVEVIDFYSAAFWEQTGSADEVIMGGGPLMHINELGLILWGFLRAKGAGHRTRLAGCGIGPLDRGAQYERAVAEILRLTDVIEMRDSASVKWAQRLTGRNDITNTGDPSELFVRQWRKEHPSAERQPFLNLYLREWTAEYQGALSQQQFEQTKANAERELGSWVRKLATELKLRPRLLAMHHFCVGNDDRDFNRRFARTHLADLDPLVEMVPFSPQQLLASMQQGTLSLCMRFHSVVFASTLEVPFFAIDYTQGGKITHYLSDRGMQRRMVEWKELAAGNWQHLMDTTVSHS
jgi:MoaA/NifB/PqqE/SkfB family radical SAM enzyme/polysaccharide pyruvyl transferase WcaK-like protein